MVKRAFSSTGQKHEFFIDLHELIFSRGSLPNAQVEDVTFHDHMCEILMSDNSGYGDARPDDISMVLFLNFTKQEVAYYLQDTPVQQPRAHTSFLSAGQATPSTSSSPCIQPTKNWSPTRSISGNTSPNKV